MRITTFSWFALVLVVVIGVLLIRSAVIWGIPDNAVRLVPLFGAGADGNLKLTASEVNEVLEPVRSRMLGVSNAGKTYATAATIAQWAAFATTAAITLIAGFFGQAPVPAGGQAGTQATTSLPAKTVRLIAFLAALASVLTGFSSLAATTATTRFKQANDVYALLVEARGKVQGVSAVSARDLLDKLQLDADRALQ